MADIRAWVGAGAGVLAVAALYPYARSIVEGRTKPNAVSWAVWALAGIMALVSYRASGASDTLWVAGAYVFNPLVVALLSLRYRAARLERLDWVCLGGVAGSALLWAAYRSAPAALYLNIIVDGFGAVPTLLKSYREPESENFDGWVIAFAASVLNFCALDRLEPAVSIYPLYAVLCTGSITTALFIGRRADAARVS